MLSTEKAIEVLYTVRAYYASLTAGYPKGKDCKGIGDVTCSEIANSCLMAIKALEQEPCEDWYDVPSDEMTLGQARQAVKDLRKRLAECLWQMPRKNEVILTKEEYGELVSSEFDNGYTKGYTEALEQNDVLDKIRAEIEELRFGQPLRKYVVDECLEIIDKYKESEDKE